MLPFFTSFEVDKQKHTLKPYMAPVNHNIINETTWLKIVHTLMGNFCQDSDDTKGTVAMEDMGNDACVLVGYHKHVSNRLKGKTCLKGGLTFCCSPVKILALIRRTKT